MYSFKEAVNLNQKTLFNVKIDLFKMLFVIQEIGLNESLTKVEKYGAYKKKVSVTTIYNLLDYINKLNRKAETHSADYIFEKYFKLRTYIENTGHPEFDVELFKIWLYR